MRALQRGNDALRVAQFGEGVDRLGVGYRYVLGVTELFEVGVLGATPG